LFLAAGNIIRALGHDRVDDLVGVAARIPVTLFTFGLAAVNLMGLPPGGAFLAKWILLTVAIEAGAWPLVVVLMAGGLLAVAYVARVLVTALMGPGGHPRIALPVAMQWSALTLALLGVVLAFTAPAVLALLDVGTPFDVPTRDFAHKGNSP
ncbi:MAG TPA: proton-conducting transporter membrane subunit, partial [Nannocystis sp.]